MKKILIGNRIPRDYFVTTGKGQSNNAVHAGSFHLALTDAGIEQGNIMTYSSILPGIARKVEKPKQIVHGEVIESIMAVANGLKGEYISSGIIYGWLYDKETTEKFGGLVCENNGTYTKPELEKLLKTSLNELYINGFSEKYELKDIELNIKSLDITKKYGTVIVSLCFVNYEVPIIE